MVPHRVVRGVRPARPFIFICFDSPMAKKKQPTSKAEKLVESLTAKLEKAEAKASKWKDEAKRLGAETKATAKELRKHKRGTVAETTGLIVPAEPEVTEAAVADAPPAAGPDDSWTVTALRVAAREQGITGYSRKSKADLLALLKG